MNKVTKLSDGTYCRGLNTSEYERIFYEYDNFHYLFSGNCFVVRNISKRKYVIKAFIDDKCSYNSLFFFEEVSSVKGIIKALKKACVLYENTFLPLLDEEKINKETFYD